MTAAPLARPTRRAWLVWGTALVAYAVAVFHRASLGVTGVEAQHRFHAGASMVSLFVVLQLAVYALLQVPVGVALDRLGSRRMIVVGALTMAAGQFAMALAHTLPAALIARVLIGAGDAMTFISVLRLVSMWFPGRTIPVVTQLTGILGQVGQIVAAYPLVSLLRTTSWEVTFAGAGAVGVLVAIAVAVAVRDAPAGVAVAAAPGVAQVRVHLLATWREPGTRLGLSTHLVTQFSGSVFGLLWGYPFLVVGEGLAPGTAAALLSLLVLVGMLVGPVIGRLVGSYPLRRSAIVFSIVGATVLLWTTVLLWPGRAPLPLLVALVVILGSNGPGSMIGFDYARTSNPAARLGGASGVVNVGGFVASLLLMLAIGLVLDLMTPGGSTAYSLGAFRVAFSMQYILWAVGLWGVLRYRGTMRRQLAADGVVIDPLHIAVSRRLRATAARR